MSIPISALLKFNAPGVKSQLQGLSRGFNKFGSNVSKAGTQLSSIGGGVRNLTLGTAPLIAVAALTTKTFADFESQMSIVKSLTGDLTDNQLKGMTAEAKRLGATTAFTATQAAEGFQFLALAGFNAEEQTGSLENVLNLAAAGSLELGRASDIATDSLSALSPAMDKSAGKAKNLAILTDQMAFIQSKSNTNIEQLGEAIKFGGGSLASFGLQLPDIIASIGALANSGLKGSMGGTALMNMFNKLLKPTSKAKEFLEKYNISLTDSEGKMRGIPSIMDDLNGALANVTDEGEKSALGIELFGIRGIRAYNALKNEGTDSLRALSAGVADSTGTAAKQAEERLNNLKGSFVKIFSAISGVALEFGELIANKLRPPIDRLTTLIGGIATAFQLAKGSIDDNSKSGELFFKTFGAERGKQIIDFIKGFIKGFNESINTIKNVIAGISTFIKTFVKSESNMSNIGTLVAKIITGLVVVVPILAGIASAIFVAGPIIFGIVQSFGLMITVVKLVGIAFGLLFSPISLVVFSIIGIGFALFKFRDRVFNVLGIIKTEFIKIFNFIKPTVIAIFSGIVDGISTAFNAISSILTPLIIPFTFVFGKIKKVVVSVLDTILNIFGLNFNDMFLLSKDILFGMLGVYVSIFNKIGNIIVDVFNNISTIIKSFFNIITNNSTSTTQKLINIFRLLKNGVTGSINFIKNKFLSIVDKILSGFENLPQILTTIKFVFSEILIIGKTGLANISDTINTWIDTISLGGIFNGIVDGGLKAFNILLAGIDIAFTFIKETFNSLIPTAFNVFAGMTDTISQAFQIIFDNATSMFNGILNIGVIIVDKMKTIFQAFGGFITTILTTPINAVMNLLQGILSKIAGSTLGRKALSLAGIEAGALQDFIKKEPTKVSGVQTIPASKNPEIASNFKKIGDVGGLQKRIIQQKSLIAPDSSKIGQNQISPVSENKNLNVVSKIFLDSKQLAIAIGKVNIENSERQGNNLDPGTKRNILENGAVPAT